jgi:hypothetical protein
MLASNGFKQCIINIPTRETATSKTLLDHVYTNVNNKYLDSGVIHTDISDHKPIYCIINNISCKFCNMSNRTTIKFSEQNREIYKDNLHNFDWSELYCTEDVNKAYNILLEGITSSCQHMIVNANRKINKIKKPWVTLSILKCIDKKAKLYKKFKKYPLNDRIRKEYYCYKSTLKKLLKNCEKNYYEVEFNKADNDTQKTLKIINSLLNKNYTSSSMPAEVTVYDNKNDNSTVTYSEPNDICNAMNDFFVNVGNQVAESIKLDGSEPKVTEFLNNRISSSIFIKPTDVNEVSNLIDRLDCNKGIGWDNIHPRLLKEGKAYILEPLVHIINKSFSTGKFPDNCKIASVTPIFKSGNPYEPGNYRPISVLPVISKIIERAMANRILDFFKFQQIFLQISIRV